jgi:hypothetical protein
MKRGKGKAWLVGIIGGAAFLLMGKSKGSPKKVAGSDTLKLGSSGFASSSLVEALQLLQKDLTRLLSDFTETDGMEMVLNSAKSGFVKNRCKDLPSYFFQNYRTFTSYFYERVRAYHVLKTRLPLAQRTRGTLAELYSAKLQTLQRDMEDFTEFVIAHNNQMEYLGKGAENG